MSCIASYPVPRTPSWAKLILAVIMCLMPSIWAPTTSAADSISTKVDAVATEVDSKLTNDAQSAPVTGEVTKNAKWLMWLLWLVVPLLTYGILIPMIVYQARQNEMDAVKRGVMALVLGSILWFGCLAMFMG